MFRKHVYVLCNSGLSYQVYFLKPWQSTQGENIHSLHFIKPEGCVSHFKSVDLSGTKMLNVNEGKWSITLLEMHPILQYNAWLSHFPSEST